MPAVLVPHGLIPELAARVSPDMLDILRRLHRAGTLRSRRELDQRKAEGLRCLAELGLVDPGFAGDTDGPPLWTVNGNGSRVLTYLTGIRGGPHYEDVGNSRSNPAAEEKQDEEPPVAGQESPARQIGFVHTDARAY